MSIDAEILYEALLERKALLAKIAAFIDSNYSPGAPRDRLRKGVVQGEIFRHISATHAPWLCRLINECMEEKGYKGIINRGDQYYAPITRQVSKAYESHQ